MSFIVNIIHAVFFCNFKGYKPVEIEWYLREDKLKAEDCSTTYSSCRKLVLSSLTEESSGNVYTCRATGLEESSWGVVQIYVDGKSINDYIVCMNFSGHNGMRESDICELFIYYRCTTEEYSAKWVSTSRKRHQWRNYQQPYAWDMGFDPACSCLYDVLCFSGVPHD